VATEDSIKSVIKKVTLF